MDPKLVTVFLICCAALAAAGCTSPASPAGTPAPPIPMEQTTAAPVVSLLPAAECSGPDDCAPVQCCHPTGCIPVSEKKPCSLLCTAACQGPLDCGAGSCGCVNGRCSIVPAAPASAADQGRTSLAIRASPARYSPIMSSTPGIRLEPVPSGFLKENATFVWNATYGWFLSWNSTDYTVTGLGVSATGNGDPVYWSFTDLPPSTEIPVTITVTATDTGSGRLLGSSAVWLAWEGNYSVAVQERT